MLELQSRDVHLVVSEVQTHQAEQPGSPIGVLKERLEQIGVVADDSGRLRDLDSENVVKAVREGDFEPPEHPAEGSRVVDGYPFGSGMIWVAPELDERLVVLFRQLANPLVYVGGFGFARVICVQRQAEGEVLPVPLVRVGVDPLFTQLA